MMPASPVIPGAPEVVIGGQQPEYIGLPAIVTDDRMVISRWEPTAAERAAIAAGGSIFLMIWTFGHPLQPLAMTTEAPAIDLLTPDGIRRIGRLDAEPDGGR
jgi:hypothetical protein